MAHDVELLKEMQKLQPWLVRVCIDDENFARILEHIDIAIIENNEQYRSYQMDDMLVLIMKGLRLNIPKDKSMLSPLSGYIFLWLRYVCITNRSLYRNVLAACFNKDTIIQSEYERREYAEGRLLGLGIPDTQLDDIYLILKGYFDTTFTIGKIAYNIVLKYYENQKEFIKKVNCRFEDTDFIKDSLSVDEIAEIVMRDFFSGKKVNEVK